MEHRIKTRRAAGVAGSSSRGKHNNKSRLLRPRPSAGVHHGYKQQEVFPTGITNVQWLHLHLAQWLHLHCPQPPTDDVSS